jgi:hypothetical protein
VDDLVVNSHFTAIVIDDEDADAATTVVEAVGEAAEQAALVKDGKALLDIAGLGHGDNVTVITDVKDAVLLEDRAEHVLDNDRRAGVADERRLLVELLGEEVDSEVAVLAGLGRGGDADDLARTALQDQQVADPDVVARDGDGVGNHGAGWGGAVGGGVVGLLAGSGGGDLAVTNDNVLFDTLGVVLVLVFVVVVCAVDGVENFVCDAVKSVAERVVVAVFVVISHITLVLTSGLDSSLSHANLFVVGDGFTIRVALGGRVFARVGGLRFPLASLSVVFFGVWGGAVTELSLSYVDAGVEVLMVLVFTVVGAVLDVDLSLGVALVWFAVAKVGWLVMSRVTCTLVPGKEHPPSEGGVR